MNTIWKPNSPSNQNFDGFDRSTGQKRWLASRFDLIFGLNSELRAVAKVYTSFDAKEKFILDFMKAWNKVINLDRFE